VCDSGELLLGRGSILGPEPNQPNTIDDCADGEIQCEGYLNDESVQQITVSSVGGGVLQEGGRARIDVQVYRYDEDSNGWVYYTAAANSSPSWTLIGKIHYGCPGGCTSYNFEFTLCPGPLQAVRVTFGNQQPNSCSDNIGLVDNDDIVFTVAPGTDQCGSSASIETVSDVPFEQPIIDCNSLNDAHEKCDYVSNCVWQVGAIGEGCYNKNKN
jgi:hypothetical protein